MDNNKYDELFKIVKENNKLIKDLHKRLYKMEKTGKKMDSHIDNVMGIYNGYKAPLDYISSYFTSNTIKDKSKKSEKNL